MNGTLHKKRVAVANVAGAFGYMSVMCQWAWSLLLLCYPLIMERPSFLLPDTSPPQARTLELSPALSPLATVLAIVVTVGVLALTIVVLARLPKAIGKKAATLTKTAAITALPVLTHHKKITKRQRKKLSHTLILSIKAVALTLPLIALLFVQQNTDIPLVAAWTIGLFCAACSLLYFTVQQTIAILGHVDRERLW